MPPGFNDAAFNNLLLNGTIGELFVAENRAGNNAIGGEREVGINQPLVPNGSGGLTGGAPFPGAEAQKVWLNGTCVLFTLTYNVTTNTATYTVAGAIPSTLTAITLTSDTDYLLITNLTSSFTLTGLQTFSWDPTFPLRSNNASQIKVFYDIDAPPFLNQQPF